MFHVSRYVEIDAGHRVPFHASKCRHLHGHRFRVTAHVQAQAVVTDEGTRPDAGMVMDFGDLKRVLMEVIHDRFDHRLMLWENDPELPRLLDCGGAVAASIVIVPCIPTAEELARYWGGLVDEALSASKGLRLSAMEVRETPASTAWWYAHQ